MATRWLGLFALAALPPGAHSSLFTKKDATDMMHIVLATDRPFAAAATLNSVCANAANAGRLVFHIVAPDEVSLEADTQLACADASFVSWPLSKVESVISSLRGQPPVWKNVKLMSVLPRHQAGDEDDSQWPRFPFSVPMSDGDLDPKHKSPFI